MDNGECVILRFSGDIMNKSIKFIVLIFLMFTCFAMLSYGYNIAYIVHRHNIALGYGEKRIIPVILDMAYDKYMYSIKIDNKNSDNNLKVSLIDEHGRVLDSQFFTSAGKDVVLVLGNKIKKYKEVYVLFEYYSPSSHNMKKKVSIDIYPLISNEISNGEVVPRISPAIHYDFNVYLNAYLPPIQQSPLSQSSIQTSQESEENLTSSHEGKLEKKGRKDASHQREGNESIEGNVSNESNAEFFDQTLKSSYGTNQDNLTGSYLKDSSQEDYTSLPTVKIIEKSWISTYILVIVCSLLLYIIWKKA